MISLPFKGHFPAAAGFVLVGTGTGPVYPAIQHMAPANFGRRRSTAVIGLQMASAHIGSALMSMVFGHLQHLAGIGVIPLFLLVFAALNITLLEIAYRQTRAKGQKA